MEIPDQSKHSCNPVSPQARSELLSVIVRAGDGSSNTGDVSCSSRVCFCAGVTGMCIRTEEVISVCLGATGMLGALASVAFGCSLLIRSRSDLIDSASLPRAVVVLRHACCCGREGRCVLEGCIFEKRSSEMVPCFVCPLSLSTTSHAILSVARDSRACSSAVVPSAGSPRCHRRAFSCAGPPCAENANWSSQPVSRALGAPPGLEESHAPPAGFRAAVRSLLVRSEWGDPRACVPPLIGVLSTCPAVRRDSTVVESMCDRAVSLPWRCSPSPPLASPPTANGAEPGQGRLLPPGAAWACRGAPPPSGAPRCTTETAPPRPLGPKGEVYFTGAGKI
jgi:hypothetical protein